MPFASPPSQAVFNPWERERWGSVGGGTLLTGAGGLSPVAYWDSRKYSGSGSLLNLGTGNLPVFGRLPGTSGAYFSTPDSAAVSVTGDIDLRADVAMDDWTPAAINSGLLGKDAASQRAFSFDVTTAGTLKLWWFQSGAAKQATSTVAPTVSDGGRLQVRITLDVDDGAGNNVAKFYTRASGTDLSVDTGWTQLGATVTQAFTTSIDDTTALLVSGIGYNYTSNPLAGNVYRALVKDGIDGTTVADFQPSLVTNTSSATFTASTGEVWTKNGTATWGGSMDLALPGGTNDPQWLPFTGEQYARLPGIAGNYLSTPDSAAWDVSGVMTGAVRMKFDASAVQALFTHYGAPGDRGWYFYLWNDGTLRFWASADGTTATANQASSAHGLSVATIYWVGWSYNTATGALAFYKAADNGSNTPPAMWGSWSEISTHSVAATVPFNSTQPLQVGSITSGTGNNFTGNVYTAKLYDDGVAVADCNIADAVEPAATHTSATTGEVWTWNRAASGRKLTLVDRPLFLFGTDDYLSTPDNALLDFAADESFTVVVAAREHTTVPGGTRLIDKRGASGAGYTLYHGTASTSRLFVSDGSNNVEDVEGFTANGYVQVLTGVRNVTADTITSYVGTSASAASTDTTTGSSANAQTFRIGSTSAGASYADMAFLGAAVFRRALSSAEVAAVVREFGVVA